MNIKEAVRNGVRKALRESKREKKVRRVVREAMREILSEDDDYQDFVKGVMETLNIDSPQDLTEEGREKFFSLLDNNYNADTDEADDVPMEELKNEMEPEHYESDSKVPDFLKKQDEQAIREATRRALRNLL